MPKCPVCGTSGAYIGFSSIECPNEKCEHFKLEEKRACGCCGSFEHSVDSCQNTLSEEYDDSGGNGPPSKYSAGCGCGDGSCSICNPVSIHPGFSSEPPDWYGD